MKRNVLLLTAVVLAAVMLSGCLFSFGKVTVKVDPVKIGTDTVVEITNLAKNGKYSKNAAVTLNAKYDFEKLEAADKTIEWTAKDKDNKAVTITATEDYKVGEDVVGKLLKFTTGKTDITITGTVKDN